jgi:O-antigen/teichoic acid export membrane protein
VTDRAGPLGRGWRSLGSIARGFVVVGGATIIGQGAILLAAPLLARLYEPTDFGLLAAFAAVLSVLVAVASLRFDLAIPIAADRDEAVHLLLLSDGISFAASVLLAVMVLLWGGEVASALGAEELAPLLWLLPIALFLASFTQALASWAIYNRTFSQLARMRVLQGVSQAGCQLALGVLHMGPLGLILGDVASRVVGAGQLIRSSMEGVRATTLSLAAVARSARERWAFARVMTAASLLSTLSLQAPFLLIPGLFDLASSGQFFLAFRVLALPASLVVAAVGQVFFGEASHRKIDPARLKDLTHDAAASLLAFSIPTYAIAMVAGQALVVAVFGAEWELAGLYAQIMAPSLIFWSVANPMSSLPLIGRRERESLLFTAAELGLKVLALGIGAALGSLTIGVVALSVTSVIIELAAMWRFLRVASVSLGDLVVPIGRTLASTLPFVALLLVVGQVAPAALPVAAVLAGIGAFGLSFRNSREARALLSKTYG